MPQQTLLNIRNIQDGSLIDLSKNRATGIMATLNQESAVDKIAMSGLTSTYWTQYLTKKVKRTQTERVPSTAVGAISVYQIASPQVIGQVEAKRYVRMDNIVLNNYDKEFLDRQNQLLADETSDFILTGKELDLAQLLEDTKTQASTIKLYNTVDEKGSPTGTQPATATTTDGSITAIASGQRSTGLITDFDAKDTNRINLIRASLKYLNRLGAKNSFEKYYPFSINGLPLNKIRILTSYGDVLNIKDSFTRTVVDLSNPDQLINYQGIVAYIDAVPVILTNQLPENTIYAIGSDRVIYREVADNNEMNGGIDYIGVIKREVGAVVTSAGTQNLGPSDVLIQYESPRLLCPFYFEEMIFINGGVQTPPEETQIQNTKK